MNKNKTIALAIVLILILILGIVIYKYKFIKRKNYKGENKNQIAYQDDVTVDELKNDISITGDSAIYEIQKEFDGRNALVVKPNIKYKVAFAGMVKKATPSMEEIDRILEEKSPKENGIWIEESSRSKLLNLINNNTNSTFVIDENGYLRIQDKNTQKDSDKKLERIIEGDRQIILCCSSICYIVDDVTGQILDYDFEDMDEYQAYEYFEDGNKMIVFINENRKSQLTEKEIFESIMQLI